MNITIKDKNIIIGAVKDTSYRSATKYPPRINNNKVKVRKP